MIDRPPPTDITPSHTHAWRDSPAVVRERRVQHSPVSHTECDVFTMVILVQSCECGALQRRNVGIEDRKVGCV